MLNCATMTNEFQIGVRVPADVNDRADALADAMRDLPEFAAFRMTRSAVFRMALLDGLAALERKHRVTAPKPRKRSAAKGA